MKIVYSFIFLLLGTTVFSQTLETDRLALVDFYNATSGQYWYINTGWNVPGSPGDSPCGWYGVTCENGRVTKLELSDFETVSSIPSSIGNLTALKSLVLIGGGAELSHLEGTIPVEMANLVNLEKLDFSGNVLTPASFAIIGSLTKLKYLSLPSVRNLPNELSNLLNLEYLYFINESVFSSGTLIIIPTYFGNFTHLKTLVIRNFGLTGAIPAELGSLSDLETLEISERFDLTGTTITIPKSLGNLSKLQSLIISGQNASGAIPSELGNLSSLQILNLSRNKLAGSIPASIGQLSNLTVLNLSYNRLSGTIPSLSSISVFANVSINNNAFTFNGMQNNVSRLDNYSNQSKLRMSATVPLRTTEMGGYLSVDAGGNDIYNTYKWYLNGGLLQTNVGYSVFRTDNLGTYRVEVTNSIATQLTLISEDYNVTYIPAMPVTLSSFSAKKQSTGNILTWQTTSETTNKGFEIERSKDAVNFENIGFIDGNGDSKATNDYSFLDKNPFTLTYYRLKQIDYDGKFEYSRIIYLKKDNAALSVYPNPVKGQLFVSGLESEENVTMHTLEGRLILDQKLQPSQPINTSKFSSGLYIIKVGEETRKVVIQN